MAAYQQKKRLTSSNLHDQHRGKKKKKLDSSDYVLSMRSHIDLEWDDSRKRAVAKREQVGIAWMDIAPFVDTIPQSRSVLADVISVPHEIFSLEDLTDVLSYEVWATCLSESERKLLTQFLPSGTGAEQVVQALLNGENHHFGNPYLKWSASLCSGNLHPDVVVRSEQQFRANKRAYYHEINRYHTGMIEVLKKWKEIWLSSNDPEKLCREGITKKKQGSLTISAESAKVSNVPKKEMPQKINIRNGDTAKYMSYIKVSKTQHELVKSLKHSGDGIQSKSLHRVLGDIKSFHVQPYETFEEDEKKRLHEHWLQVAKKDLPAAFEVYRDRKFLREQWGKSLEQELAEEKKSMTVKDEIMDDMESSPQKPVDDGDSDPNLRPDVRGQEDVDSADDSTSDRNLEHVPSLNSCQEHSAMVINQEAAEGDAINPADNSPHLSRSLGEQNPSDDDVTEPKVSPVSTKDVWQNENIHDSYYDTAPQRCGYSCASELSLRQPQLPEEHPSHVIDLERDIIEPEAGDSVASAFNMDNGPSLFSSYASQDRDELLPTYSKEPGTMSSYPQEHLNGLKQPGLQFLMANGLPESSQFSHQFQEQQQLLEQRQIREKELYMHQIMGKNVFSSARYPNHSHISSVDPQGFAAFQSSGNGGSMGYNWFPDDHQAYSSWSGVESSSGGGHCLGDGGNADGSLFGVLSNRLPSCLPYEATSSEQYLQARHYVSGGIPGTENIYGHAYHQLDNSRSQATSAATSMNNAAWMNFSHQSPGLHDSMGKPFLKPWNR